MTSKNSEAERQSITIPWKQSPQKTYIFSGAHVISPVDGTITENATIRIASGVVESVEYSGGRESANSNAYHVDLSGKFIIPGLIDCHVHIAAVPGETSLQAMKDMSEKTRALRQPHVTRTMLARGFTTVRDCGGADLALKQSITDGVHAGPRLFIAGHALSQTGGHGDMRQAHDSHECCAGEVLGIGRIVDGEEQCFKYAREEIRQGSDFLKIMGGGGVASPTDKIEHLQLSDKEIAAIVRVAKNAGTYVTTHAYTPEAIQQAAKEGVMGVEHGNLLDEPTADMMAERGVFLTPTLVTYATMASSAAGSFLPPKSMAKNQEVLAKGFHAIEIAKRAGVTICFGTDLLGPLQYAQSNEFALRAKVLGSLEILQSATINAARMLGQEKYLGQSSARVSSRSANSRSEPAR